MFVGRSISNGGRLRERPAGSVDTDYLLRVYLGAHDYTDVAEGIAAIVGRQEHQPWRAVDP